MIITTLALTVNMQVNKLCLLRRIINPTQYVFSSYYVLGDIDAPPSLHINSMKSFQQIFHCHRVVRWLSLVES